MSACCTACCPADAPWLGVGAPGQDVHQAGLPAQEGVAPRAHGPAPPCRPPRNLDSRAFITIGDRVGVVGPWEVAAGGGRSWAGAERWLPAADQWPAWGRGGGCLLGPW